MIRLLVLTCLLAQTGGETPTWVGHARDVVRAKRTYLAAASRLDGDRKGLPEALATAEAALCASAPSASDMVRQVEAGPFSSEAVLAIAMPCKAAANAETARVVLAAMPRIGDDIQRDVWWFLYRLPKDAITELWPLVEARLREVKDWRIALEAAQVLRKGPPATQGEILGVYFVQAPSVSRRLLAAMTVGSGPAGVAAFRAKVIESGDKTAVRDLNIIEDG